MASFGCPARCFSPELSFVVACPTCGGAARTPQTITREKGGPAALPPASLPPGPRHKRSKSLRHRHGHALQLYLAGPSCPHGCALQGHVRLAPGAARLDEQCAAEHRVALTSVEQHMAVLGDRARRARAAVEQSDFCGEKNHLARRRAIAARAASCCAGCAPNEWQLRRRGADAHLPAAIEPS